jgi:hypothetical protein
MLVNRDDSPPPSEAAFEGPRVNSLHGRTGHKIRWDFPQNCPTGAEEARLAAEDREALEETGEA